MSDQHPQEIEEQEQTLTYPPSSFVIMIDQLLATEDQYLLTCVTEALNLWWRCQRLTGRGAANNEDTKRLLGNFILVLRAQESREDRVSEFAPRNRMTPDQRGRVMQELGEIVAPKRA